MIKGFYCSKVLNSFFPSEGLFDIIMSIIITNILFLMYLIIFFYLSDIN